jgi:hypothetical protein
VGPRAGLDAMEERKISCPYREWNPGRPARSPVDIPTELSRLPIQPSTWKKMSERTWELTKQCSENGGNMQICCTVILKGLCGHSVLYVADVPFKLKHSIIFMDFEYRLGRFDMCGFN